METGSRFLDALQTRVLVGDGAMGTQGQKLGLEPGGSGELWNIEKPSKVLRIQRQYVEAGADCLTTNTFGASRIMLKRHGCDDVSGVNRRGVEIARQAFGNRQGFVAIRPACVQRRSGAASPRNRILPSADERTLGSSLGCRLPPRR